MDNIHASVRRLWSAHFGHVFTQTRSIQLIQLPFCILSETEIRQSVHRKILRVKVTILQDLEVYVVGHSGRRKTEGLCGMNSSKIFHLSSKANMYLFYLDMFIGNKKYAKLCKIWRTKID